MKTETSKDGKKTTFTKGSRIAQITCHENRVAVYVGFEGDKTCPGEETIPARFFNGTCSRDYKTYTGAMKAVNKFLGE